MVPDFLDSDSGSSDPDDGFTTEIEREMARLTKRQAQIEAALRSVQESEQLCCPQCGLVQNLTDDGDLITCRPDQPGRDIGQRFVALDESEHRWQCPVCGAQFRQEHSQA